MNKQVMPVQKGNGEDDKLMSLGVEAAKSYFGSAKGQQMIDQAKETGTDIMAAVKRRLGMQNGGSL